MIAPCLPQPSSPQSGPGWQWDASSRHIVLLFDVVEHEDAVLGDDPDAEGFRVRVGPCPEMPSCADCAAQVKALLGRVAGSGVNLVPLTPEEYVSRNFKP